MCLNVVIKFDYSCVMHAVYSRNRVRRSTDFLHGDCREPVCARRASWYLVVQVHNAPARRKNGKKGRKITDVDEVVSQKTFMIQSYLSHRVNAHLLPTIIHTLLNLSLFA